MYEMLSFREGTLKLHLELTHFVSFYYSLFLLKIDTSLIQYILTRVSISSPPSSSHLNSPPDLLFFHFLFRKKQVSKKQQTYGTKQDIIGEKKNPHIKTGQGSGPEQC